MDNASSTMMKGSRLENRVLMHPHLSLKALISLFLPPSLSLSLFLSHSSVYLRRSNLIHSYITDAIYLSTPKYLSAQQTLFNPSFQNFMLQHAPTGFMPCMSHMSVHHPYLCEHSPFNSFSNPLVIYHHSPQHLTHIIHPH